MTHTIIANCIAAVGMIALLISTTLKEKRKIVVMQSANHTCAVISNLLLGGYSGAVQEAVNLARNIFLLLVGKFTLFWKLFFIVLAISLGMWTCFAGGFFWYELLPVFATALYSIVIVGEKSSALVIKGATVICTFTWAVYSVFVRNYVYVFSNILTTVFGLIFIARELRRKGASQ